MFGFDFAVQHRSLLCMCIYYPCAIRHCVALRGCVCHDTNCRIVQFAKAKLQARSLPIFHFSAAMF